MDNLGVHISKKNKKYMSALKFKWIFNASYSPDLNPIEGVIGITKNCIKRERLKALVKGHDAEIEELIESSFHKVKKGVIRNLIKRL